jgi:tRNA dimethylallyltransferase
MSSIKSDLPRLFPVIMGPTASGKSALALELAEKCNGEILSVDSMQIYRGLDIGTAKPTPEEQKRIPHHLIDIQEINSKYDVFRFAADSERILQEIRSRGKLPVAAGGTGMYMRALLYGLDPVPADPRLRAELDQQYDNDENYPQLCALMEKEDAEDFAKFASNRRRLLRAREVFLLTGQSFVSLQSKWKERPPRQDAASFVLVWENEELRTRIRERCRIMLQTGWIEEAEHFLHSGLGKTPTAWQVLGYRLIADFLQGKIPRQELEERIVTETWQFARRQNTWFRTQHPEAHRLAMPCPHTLEMIRKICGF